MNKEDERPFLVTLLGLGVLILTVFNAVRFGSALVQWDLLLDFASQPGPIYIATTGLIWALGWLIVYLSIEYNWKWARKSTLALSILYAAYYWIDRFLFQTFQARNNIFFVSVSTILGLAFVILALTLPKSRVYFVDRDS